MARYADGTKYYNLGEYKKAREEFRAAYLAVPDPSFLFNIGQCARMLGEGEEAIRSYRAFLRERPDTVNRAEVERFIAELQRPKDAKAPASVESPKPAPAEAVAKPAAAVVGTPAPVVAAARETPDYSVWRRWWLWAAVAAVVVAGGAAVALAVVFGGAKDGPDPGGSAGSASVSF
ncbi:MAG: tetratricopeptide repeat protein [Myxococcales bacterium]|nr:tetratricopeptide repeat protein [Myxococcales bacterium]